MIGKKYEVQRIVELNGAETQPRWDQTLRAIVAGTAASTGDEFFRALVSQ